MEFIEFTSFRLLVEFYQLFKGPEIDVVINVELSALVLLNAIVAHFVVVPVHDETSMQYGSLIPRLLWRFAGFELTIMTMHTCFPQKIRFSPENSLPSPVIYYTEETSHLEQLPQSAHINCKPDTIQLERMLATNLVAHHNPWWP